MNLRIKSIEDVIFEGQIKKASFPSIDGDFVVLNNHADTIAILQEGKIKISLDNKRH